MIISIPLNDLLATYQHVEPTLQRGKMSLRDFISTSVTVMDQVELADPRNFSSSPSYYLDFTTPLSEFEEKIQRINPTNCYEDVDDAVFHHQLTALALEVYYELVNSLRVYSITEHPMLSRSVIGWRGQNMLVRVCRRV